MTRHARRRILRGLSSVMTNALLLLIAIVAIGSLLLIGVSAVVIADLLDVYTALTP